MIWIILGGLFLVGGITLALMPSLLGKGEARSFGGAVGAIGKTVGVLSIVIGIFFLASTSFVSIDADRVGHLKRIYGFSDLPEGRIIATDGQPIALRRQIPASANRTGRFRPIGAVLKW